MILTKEIDEFFYKKKAEEMLSILKGMTVAQAKELIRIVLETVSDDAVI